MTVRFASTHFSTTSIRSSQFMMVHSHPGLTLTRICLFLSLAAPVVYLNSFFFPFVTPRAIFLFAVGLVTLVSLVWFMCSRRGWVPVWSPIGTAVTIFVVVQIIAALFGADPLMSFWSNPGRMTGTFLSVHLLVLFVAMITVLRTRRAWDIFFSANVSVALVNALLYFLSRGGIITLQITNGVPTWGNSTLYGGYLLFQIAIALYLLAASSRSWMRWYGAFAATALTATLFLTDARAAQVSLVSGLVFAGALTLFTRGRARAVRWTGASVIGVMMAAFFLVVGLLFVPDSAIRNQFIRLTSQSRLIVWDIAWKGFLERPLLGWGPENFEFVFAKYYHPCFGSEACQTAYWFDRAHNIILDTLVHVGLLGLIAYLWVFAVTIILLWRAFRRGAVNDVSAIFVTTILVSYFVQNLTGFDSILSIFAWFVILAFAHFLLTDGKMPRVCNRTILWIPSLVFIVFPFLFTFFVVRPVLAFTSIVATEKASSMDEHLKLYERAATVSSVGLAYRRAYLAHMTNVRLWHTPSVSFTRVREAAMTEIGIAERGLTDTLRRLPADLSSLIELGRLLQVEGRFVDASLYARAEEVLRQAVRLHPLNPNAAWPLASVLLEQGKVEEAVALTKAVLDREPRVLKAHTAHLVAVKFLRDDDLLIQTARQSAEAIPGLFGQLQYIVSEDFDERRLLFLGHFY